MTRLWNEGDYIDNRIFAYERERGYFTSPIFSPLCSLLSDIVMFKLTPPIFASFTLYPLLRLNPEWHVWGNFVCALCLMQIAGASYSKVHQTHIYICVHTLFLTRTHARIHKNTHTLLQTHTHTREHKGPKKI